MLNHKPMKYNGIMAVVSNKKTKSQAEIERLNKRVSELEKQVAELVEINNNCIVVDDFKDANMLNEQELIEIRGQVKTDFDYWSIVPLSYPQLQTFMENKVVCKKCGYTFYAKDKHNIRLENAPIQYLGDLFCPDCNELLLDKNTDLVEK